MSVGRRRRCKCFFQAEGGIRDLTVTGVQTCALPIFGRRHLAGPGWSAVQGERMRWITPAARPGIRPATALAATTLLVALAATAPASVQAQTAPAAADASIAVRAFRVQGNTLLDPAMVQATLAPHVGQRRLAELRQAALAVQALYGQAGYAAVVAYLPPQPVSDGTVTIQEQEGRIPRAPVKGQRRL